MTKPRKKPGPKPSETTLTLRRVLAKMPPLRHDIRPPGSTDIPFQIAKSEVIQWAIQQPELLMILWFKMRDSEALIFNQTSKMWAGKDYDSFAQ